MDIELANWILKVRAFVEGYGSVVSILDGQLDMWKLSANGCRVCSQLTRNAMVTSKEYLALFDRSPDQFLSCFKTVDESWFHYNRKETNK